MTAIDPGFRRNTSLMAIGTVISRVTGFARTVLIVIALGAGAQSLGDAYTLANTIPNIVYDLVIGGVLSATLVPVFAQHFARNKVDEAWEAVSVVLTAILLAITVLTVAVMVTAPQIIDLYTFLDDGETAQDQRETAAFLLRFFAPQIAIYGFVSVATALLHTRRRFAPPMFAPILNNLVVITMLMTLPLIGADLTLENVQDDPWVLTFLGIGTTLGVAAMGAILIPYVRQTSQGNLRLRLNLRHPALASLLRMSGWTVGFVIANQIAFWVTMLLADTVGGGIIAFTLAYQLFILPHGVLSVSIMSALQPELADKWARSAINEFKHTMTTGLRTLLLAVVPIGFLMSVLSAPIVEIIFHFSDASEELQGEVSQLVAFMTIGLAGFSIFLFLTRVLQAMHAARTVFLLYVFENAINIGTAFPLFDTFGLAGLGLSNSIAYSVASVVAFWTIRSKIGAIGGQALLASMGRILAATALTTATAGLLVNWTDEFNALLQLFVAGGAGLVVLVGLLRVIAPKEFGLVMRLPRRGKKESSA